MQIMQRSNNGSRIVQITTFILLRVMLLYYRPFEQFNNLYTKLASYTEQLKSLVLAIFEGMSLHRT